MKKTILHTFAFIAFSYAVSAQDSKVTTTTTAGETTTQPASTAEFKFELDDYNFGTIKQGDKVEYEFNFTNVGKDALVITNAAGSCGCTVPVWPKEPIKKGETGKIQVTFNSAGKQGMQDKTVTITSNAVTSPKVLHIRGNVEMPPQQKPAEAPKN